MSKKENATPKTLVLNDQGGSIMGISEDVTNTLRSEEHGHQPIVLGLETYHCNTEKELAQTLKARDYKDPQCVAYKKTSHPKRPEDGQGWAETEVNDTLNSFDNGEVRTPTVVLENHPNDSRVKISENGVVQTLSSRMGTGGGNVPLVVDDAQTVPRLTVNNVRGEQRMPNKDNFNAVITKETSQSVVRRLTPKECERLQGFPDDWTNIGEWTDTKDKKHKDADSPRYKALGNSIALPSWEWLAERIINQLKEDGKENTTMASLFDGIGGFPLVFSRHGCKPVWASEIEEFPMAVTKKRFLEEGEEDG